MPYLANCREVNEDNMLFRNVLAEFEESFKYVSKDSCKSLWAASVLFRTADFRFLPSSLCQLCDIEQSQGGLPHILLQTESRILLNKLVNKYPPEIDASTLQKILKGHWKHYLLEKPSLELCKSLVMLRDYNISGRVNLMEIPLLLHLLHFWRVRMSNRKY